LTCTSVSNETFKDDLQMRQRESRFCRVKTSFLRQVADKLDAVADYRQLNDSAAISKT